MTTAELQKANELNKKINQLSYFMNHTLQNRPQSKIKLTKDKIKGFFIRAEGYGALEMDQLELTDETMEIIEIGLEHELSRLKDEFAKLGKEQE